MFKEKKVNIVDINPCNHCKLFERVSWKTTNFLNHDHPCICMWHCDSNGSFDKKKSFVVCLFKQNSLVVCIGSDFYLMCPKTLKCVSGSSLDDSWLWLCLIQGSRELRLLSRYHEPHKSNNKAISAFPYSYQVPVATKFCETNKQKASVAYSSKQLFSTQVCKCDGLAWAQPDNSCISD